MSLVAPTLQAFFTDRLTRQLQASPRTIASYRDTLKLLLAFVNEQTGRPPAKLDWEDLNEPIISRFLDHLETAGTAPEPGTYGSPRSGHCSNTPHSGIPSTSPRSLRFSRSHPNAIRSDRSRF